ncbi:MAG TPA: sugar ABC transporter substrate-binding protein [Thermomicrobiales bacterium]|nr:sugar ABC transporter substrate-binding protein [Thermomicrobiales bacterium]
MTSDRLRRHLGQAEVNRRRLLGGALGLAGTAAVGGRRSLAAPAAAQDAFDWKRFDGTQIRLLANAHPWTNSVKPVLGEFQELTGIQIQAEDLPEAQFRQKLTTELSQGTGSVDVMMSAPAQEGLKYDQAGWYEPLDRFVQDPALTAPDYDFADFSPRPIEMQTVNDKLIGIPVQLESTMIIYRKDLFEEKGIEALATFADLEAAAQALHDPDNRLFGVGLRGKGAAATSQWASFLYGFGGDWLGPDGQPALASQQAIDAFTYYGNLARNYGPRGVENNSWAENVALFQQGQLGILVDASVFKVNVEDPTASTVAGKVGYAAFPAGPAAHDVALFTWGLSIPASSKNKEAAWYFVQWATSKAQNLALLQKGIPVARQSAWQDPAYTEGSNKEFDQAQQTSIEISKHTSNPPVVSVQEVRDAVGPAIVAAIQGGDVAGAAQQANDAFKNILAQSG